MSYDDHDRCRRCGAPDDGHSRDECDRRTNARAELPRLTRRSDGKVFRITFQARSPDGSVSLLADDGPPFERVETTNDRLDVDFIDSRDAVEASPMPRIPTPAELRPKPADYSARIVDATANAVRQLTESQGDRAEICEDMPVVNAVANALRAAGWACAVAPNRDAKTGVLRATAPSPIDPRLFR